MISTINNCVVMEIRRYSQNLCIYGGMHSCMLPKVPNQTYLGDISGHSGYL